MKKEKKSIAINIFFIVSILLLVILFLPILIVDNELIASSKYFLKFENMFSGIFPNLDNYSSSYGYYNLSEKAKLSFLLSVPVTFLTLFTFLYVLIKTYLCSMGYITYNKLFISEGLKKAQVTVKELMLFLVSSIIALIMYGDKYFGKTNKTIDITSRTDYLYNGNSLIIIIESIFGYLLAILLSFSILVIFIFVSNKLKQYSRS